MAGQRCVLLSILCCVGKTRLVVRRAWRVLEQTPRHPLWRDVGKQANTAESPCESSLCIFSL